MPNLLQSCSQGAKRKQLVEVLKIAFTVSFSNPVSQLCSVMENSGDAKNEESVSKKPKCSMTICYNAESKSRANVLYNSLRVDQEPKSVIRELSVHDSTLTINLASSSITYLRASSNGILENIKTLCDVIEKFELSQEYSYNHF